MIAIGITGGIGSGKSTVCALFQEKSIPIFFADDVAKEIAQKNSIARKSIEKLFGNMYDTEGKLLNKKLAEIVFSSAKELQKLNAVIHPLVFEEFQQWKKTLHTTSYCLVEAALLFESGMDELVDYTFSIVTDDIVRIARVSSRDSVTEKQVAQRMQFQISNDEHRSLADFVLENNDSIVELKQKVSFYHILFSTLKQREEEL